MTDPPGEPASPLDDVVVVLDHPKDLVNIAGVVRAMKNMGLSRLRLVRPDEFDAYRITGIAHRTDDIVEAAEHFESLEDAVTDAVWVVGTTARSRTAQRNYDRPREAASVILEQARKGPVAILLGREDRGLTNEALDLCQSILIIPTDPEYSSLNLAQAFLIIAYELRMAGIGEGVELPDLPEGKRADRPATTEELEQMYGALEAGLERIEFFKARLPESVMRTLRTVFSRAHLDRREARLFAAIGFEVVNYLKRVLDDDAPDPGGESASPH